MLEELADGEVAVGGHVAHGLRRRQDVGRQLGEQRRAARLGGAEHTLGLLLGEAKVGRLRHEIGFRLRRGDLLVDQRHKLRVLCGLLGGLSARANLAVKRQQVLRPFLRGLADGQVALFLGQSVEALRLSFGRSQRLGFRHEGILGEGHFELVAGERFELELADLLLLGLRTLDEFLVAFDEPLGLVLEVASAVGVSQSRVDREDGVELRLRESVQKFVGFRVGQAAFLEDREHGLGAPLEVGLLGRRRLLQPLDEARERAPKERLFDAFDLALATFGLAGHASVVGPLGQSSGIRGRHTERLKLRSELGHEVRLRQALGVQHRLASQLLELRHAGLLHLLLADQACGNFLKLRGHLLRGLLRQAEVDGPRLRDEFFQNLGVNLHALDLSLDFAAELVEVVLRHVGRAAVDDGLDLGVGGLGQSLGRVLLLKERLEFVDDGLGGFRCLVAFPLPVGVLDGRVGLVVGRTFGGRGGASFLPERLGQRVCQPVALGAGRRVHRVQFRQRSGTHKTLGNRSSNAGGRGLHLVLHLRANLLVEGDFLDAVGQLLVERADAVRHQLDAAEPKVAVVFQFVDLGGVAVVLQSLAQLETLLGVKLGPRHDLLDFFQQGLRAVHPKRAEVIGDLLALLGFKLLQRGKHVADVVGAGTQDTAGGSGRQVGAEHDAVPVASEHPDEAAIAVGHHGQSVASQFHLENRGGRGLSAKAKLVGVPEVGFRVEELKRDALGIGRGAGGNNGLAVCVRREADGAHRRVAQRSQLLGGADVAGLGHAENLRQLEVAVRLLGEGANSRLLLLRVGVQRSAAGAFRFGKLLDGGDGRLNLGFKVGQRVGTVERLHILLAPVADEVVAQAAARRVAEDLVEGRLEPVEEAAQHAGFLETRRAFAVEEVFQLADEDFLLSGLLLVRVVAPA